MKALTKENEGHEVRGPGERCRNRWQAAMPWKGGHTQFGWHWCTLKAGHPGPCQCVHGEVPEDTELYRDDHQQRLVPSR